jgi:hypothetical protein
MTLIPVLCHVSTKISVFVLLVCSMLDWDRTLMLCILAVIATQYCHYVDDLDNLAALETADVQVVHV